MAPDTCLNMKSLGAFFLFEMFGDVEFGANEREDKDCDNDDCEGNDCVGNDVKESDSKCASGSVVGDGNKVVELVEAD